MKQIPFLSSSFGSSYRLLVLIKFFNVFTNTSEMGQCKQRMFTGGGVNILLVSFTDISSPAVRRMRGARTEKSC